MSRYCVVEIYKPKSAPSDEIQGLSVEPGGPANCLRLEHPTAVCTRNHCQGISLATDQYKENHASATAHTLQPTYIWARLLLLLLSGPASRISLLHMRSKLKPHVVAQGCNRVRARRRVLPQSAVVRAQGPPSTRTQGPTTQRANSAALSLRSSQTVSTQRTHTRQRAPQLCCHSKTPTLLRITN